MPEASSHLSMVPISTFHWVLFLLAVLILLALDLGIFHRKARVVKFREALGWTIFWFTLAMGFCITLRSLPEYGVEQSQLFLTGYLIELSLSMDNVFVMALIFNYFLVPAKYQHRVLFWGIMGALFLRGFMIFMGVALIERFHWMLYIFGAFLVFTGIKMVFAEEDGIHPERNPIVNLARRFFPVSREYDGQKFFTWQNGRRMLTPLALVLLMVETTDLVFALDSIPAIFGITHDPFIIFTSNVFAILGLRSLYFVLARAIEYFSYLKYGLSVVLVFIGLKMLAMDWIHIPTRISLTIVVTVISSSVLVSILVARRHHAKLRGDTSFFRRPGS